MCNFAESAIKEKELNYQLDEKDKEILKVLQHSARLTNKELAARVHLSTTPTYERVKRLERTGFIKQYATILDSQKLNKGFAVFCSVKLRHLNSERALAFCEMVKKITSNSCSTYWAATTISLLWKAHLSWKK